jgi:hypothetical protein
MYSGNGAHRAEASDTAVGESAAQCAPRMYREGGVLRFWRGLGPMLWRASVRTLRDRVPWAHMVMEITDMVHSATH